MSSTMGTVPPRRSSRFGVGHCTAWTEAGRADHAGSAGRSALGVARRSGASGSAGRAGERPAWGDLGERGFSREARDHRGREQRRGDVSGQPNHHSLRIEKQDTIAVLPKTKQEYVGSVEKRYGVRRLRCPIYVPPACVGWDRDTVYADGQRSA